MKKIIFLSLLISLISAPATAYIDWTPLPVDENYTEKVIDSKFVFIKGGCFEMGDTFGDGNDDEKPVHEVCVDDFYLGEHEVTQGEWKKITGNNPSYFSRGAFCLSPLLSRPKKITGNNPSYFSGCGNDCPVEAVSWNDAQEFIRKLNRKTDKDYRLPTEAEWEYAARERGKKIRYAGTNSESGLGKYAWHGGNSEKKTHRVKMKKPNALNLYDMSGNVWEWVSDWYDSAYYDRSPRDNPKGPLSRSYRVNRGGSWRDSPRYLRAAGRYSYTSDNRYYDVGFRLARTP